MKITVPYYSQFIDVNDPFWMLRACGATSLKMVAEFHGILVPAILDLCNEARDRGGYDIDNGWVHDYLVQKAQELGLHAKRKEGLTSIDEIIASLDSGNPVIVSVEKRVLEQKRFHIIVLVGYEVRDDSIKYFFYHEPESTNKEKGKYRMCDENTFMEYWRGKAIFMRKDRDIKV